MENADAKGENSQTNEPHSNGITNSLLTDRSYVNKSEIAEKGEKEDDLDSNEKFLKRKRDAEVNVSLLHNDCRETNTIYKEGKN